MTSLLARIAPMLLALALALPAATAHAQESTTLPPADDYETTRGMAMGLGARASAVATSDAAGLGRWPRPAMRIAPRPRTTPERAACRRW